MQKGDKHAELKQTITDVFNEHRGRYGYRRVTATVSQLHRRPINHKTVQNLMKQLDLKARVRVKKYQSFKGEIGRAAPNELQRNFKAQRPNEKWVTDVTEFKVGSEKLYLAPVMDLYNGEIIAFEMNRRPVFELVSGMLKKALERLPANHRVTLHSDQGWHYRMPGYQSLLKSRDVVQSMSRKGNCLDNAAMESFFAVLKTEFFHLNSFDSVDQLASGIEQYIDYYNNDRIKMKLNGMSPVRYRTHAQLSH